SDVNGLSLAGLCGCRTILHSAWFTPVTLLFGPLFSQARRAVETSCALAAQGASTSALPPSGLALAVPPRNSAACTQCNLYFRPNDGSPRRIGPGRRIRHSIPYRTTPPTEFHFFITSSMSWFFLDTI